MWRKIFTTIIIILILAGAGYWWFYMKPQHSPSTNNRMRMATVTVADVKSVTKPNTIEAMGTANANESVMITATVTERVEKIYFDDGQFVKKGDMLVQLVTAEEQAQLREAKAKLQEAIKQHKRIKQLASKDFIAQSVYDTRIAELRAAEEKLNAIKARINERTIRAPFSGMLGFRKISEGALVEPGTEIVTLDAINPIKLDFNLPEKYFGRVKQGQQVIATSIAFPNKQFKGTIRTIRSRIDEATRSFRARAIIANKENLLRPGMHLQVAIQLPSTSVLEIPEQALVPVDDKQYVYVVQPDSTVQRREVTIVKRSHGNVEVSGGLKLGEKVVVDGGFKLRPGQKVIVISNNKKQR